MGCPRALWFLQASGQKGVGRKGVLRHSGLSSRRKSTDCLCAVPILDSELLHGLPKLGFFRPHPMSISKI